MNELQEKAIEIINHYGYRHQIKKFAEEAFELQEALIDFDWIFNDIDISKEYIVEEIADVEVLLMQFMLLLGIEKQDIMQVMMSKIDRQFDRINKETERYEKEDDAR